MKLKAFFIMFTIVVLQPLYFIIILLQEILK